MPKVSVIIPAYNNADTIVRCVNSILNQSFEEYEILICDDASEDNTVEVLKEKFQHLNKVTILRNSENMKAAFTRNKLIEQSNSPYICIQDADDYSHKDRLQKQVEFLENNLEYSFVGSNVISVDNGNEWRRTNFYSNPDKNKYIVGFPFIHGSIIFRRKALLENGCYRVSKETIRGQDSDLIFRMFINGYKGYNLKDCLYYYEETKETFKKRSLSKRYIALRNKSKYFPFKELSIKQKILILRTLTLGFIPPTLYYHLMRYRAKIIK